MLAELNYCRCEPCVRDFVDGQLLLHAELTKNRRLGVKGWHLDARHRNERVYEADGIYPGVGCTKIFGLVTNRKKLATTIGISFRFAPSAHAARAWSRTANAFLW